MQNCSFSCYSYSSCKALETLESYFFHNWHTHSCYRVLVFSYVLRNTANFGEYSCRNLNILFSFSAMCNGSSIFSPWLSGKKCTFLPLWKQKAAASSAKRGTTLCFLNNTKSMRHANYAKWFCTNALMHNRKCALLFLFNLLAYMKVYKYIHIPKHKKSSF